MTSIYLSIYLRTTVIIYHVSYLLILLVWQPEVTHIYRFHSNVYSSKLSHLSPPVMRHIIKKQVCSSHLKTHLSFQCPYKPVALFSLYSTTPPPQSSCVNVPSRYSHRHSQPGRMKYTNIHSTHAQA